MNLKILKHKRKSCLKNKKIQWLDNNLNAKILLISMNKRLLLRNPIFLHSYNNRCKNRPKKEIASQIIKKIVIIISLIIITTSKLMNYN